MKAVDLTLIMVSMVSFFIYRAYCIKKYGKKGSISAYAGPLTKDGKQIFVFLFIMLSFTVLSYVGRTWFSIIAGMLITGIGTLTGYDPDIRPRKAQDIVHVILVNVAILLFALNMVFTNLFYGFFVGVWLVVTVVLWATKAEDHTRLIEELYMYMVIWPCLLLERVIL